VWGAKGFSLWNLCSRTWVPECEERPSAGARGRRAALGCVGCESACAAVSGGLSVQQEMSVLSSHPGCPHSQRLSPWLVLGARRSGNKGRAQCPLPTNTCGQSWHLGGQVRAGRQPSGRGRAAVGWAQAPAGRRGSRRLRPAPRPIGSPSGAPRGGPLGCEAFPCGVPGAPCLGPPWPPAHAPLPGSVRRIGHSLVSGPAEAACPGDGGACPGRARPGGTWGLGQRTVTSVPGGSHQASGRGSSRRGPLPHPPPPPPSLTCGCAHSQSAPGCGAHGQPREPAPDTARHQGATGSRAPGILSVSPHAAGWFQPRPNTPNIRPGPRPTYDAAPVQGGRGWGSQRPLRSPQALGPLGSGSLDTPTRPTSSAPATALVQLGPGRSLGTGSDPSWLRAVFQGPGICWDGRPAEQTSRTQEASHLQEAHAERLVLLPTSFGEMLAFFCSNAVVQGHPPPWLWPELPPGSRLEAAAPGVGGVLCWQVGLLLEQYWRYPHHRVPALGAQARPLHHAVRHEPTAARPCPPLSAGAGRARPQDIYSLYKFKLSARLGTPGAHTPCPDLPAMLDSGIRLQRLSPDKVAFRLCNSTGGDCFCHTHASGVTAAHMWYRLHYLSVLALLPPRSRAPPLPPLLSLHGQDCQARHLWTAEHPTYGSCYTFDAAWAPRRPGVTHRLSLVLRAEQQAHLTLLSPAAGIQVLVHRPDHSPFLGAPGFSVRPATETTVCVREVGWLCEVHRLGSPYGRCAHDSGGVDVQLLFASYTRWACLVSCFQQLVVDTCSCGHYLFPLPAGVEYCSSARHPAWGHCFYCLRRELEAHQLACTWRCPRPCRESSYTLSAGTSTWPSSKSAVSSLEGG
ncbi:LOW QUALITY PROTEIN: Amiloride-sensitive sodium channel subunit delta, partial [Galemys pyrenaicus]